MADFVPSQKLRALETENFVQEIEKLQLPIVDF